MAIAIKRLLAESVSIAVVLLAWTVLSIVGLGDGTVQFAIRLGGLVMGALYAFVRGLALATHTAPAYEDPDARGVLAENGRAMLAGVPWFALGLVTAVLAQVVLGLGLPIPWHGSLLRSTLAGLVEVFAATGVLTVSLVAVASGTSAVRSVRTM